MARAAKSAGLQHVIWSTFEDTRESIPLDDDRMPTLQEKYKVAHFDGKARANHDFADAGVPTTFLLTSFYWENFIYFAMGPARGEDGVLARHVPDGRQEAPEHRGRGHRQVRLRDLQDAATEYLGETVGIAGEHLTGSEIAAAFTKALGEEVRYNDVPADVFRSFGFPGADDVGNMFQFKRDFNDAYVGARSLEFSRSLNPELQTLDAWLAANVSRVPIG